jgi:hypothetical protein
LGYRKFWYRSIYGGFLIHSEICWSLNWVFV